MNPSSASHAEVPILVDQWNLHEPGADRGLGRYALEVRAAAARIAPDRVRFLAKPVVKPGGAPPLSMNVATRAVPGGTPKVLHVMSAHHLPLRKGRHTAWVTSIQDVIPLDLREYRRLGVRTNAAFVNARRSDVILANSSYTADRVMSRLGIPSARIVVCPIGVSEIFRGHSMVGNPPAATFSGTPARPYVFVLADGRTPDPRKRYHWVQIVAAALIPRGVTTVVGGRGLSPTDFPGCHLVTTPSDADLVDLYDNAVASYFPSAYEGQGLPPIESMARGTPVVAYRNTSLIEVVDQGGILLEDPAPWQAARLDYPLTAKDADNVAQAVIELADPARRSIWSERALASSGRFTTQRFDEALAEAYRLAEQHL